MIDLPAMTLHIRFLLLVLPLISLAPLAANAQTWGDSLSRDERFWGHSGGYARQLALGAGGFGMLTDTGVKTLGTNPFSVDPAFMLTNPAYATHYSSYLWFDAGLSGNGSEGLGEQFGGTFSLSDNFTGGIVLARSDAQGFSLINPNIFGEVTNLSNNYPYFPPQNTWEVMGALRAGSVDFGLALSYATSSANTSGQSSLDTTSRFADFKQLGFSGGLLVRGDDGLLFDLDANALLPSITSGTSTVGKISVTAFGVNTRMFIPVKKDFYFVPIANLYLSSGTSTFLATPKDLPSSTNIDAGAGVNFWQGGIHIMSGVTFGFYKQITPAIADISPSTSKSQTIVPRWTIGAEWPVVKWFTARLGYFASSGSETTEQKLTATTTSTTTLGKADLYSPFFGSPNSGVPTSGLNVGASFVIARFTIDAVVSTIALHDPFAGFARSDGMFGFMTLSYKFE